MYESRLQILTMIKNNIICLDLLIIALNLNHTFIAKTETEFDKTTILIVCGHTKKMSSKDSATVF